jgi:hypothetical protein
MTKTAEEYFRDWESTAFGFGYGSGEEHIIPQLKRFLDLVDHQYDYAVLEKELGPFVCWSLINTLCRQQVIEYGSSPRYGWLTPQGHALKDFVGARTDEQLVEIVTGYGPEVTICYPDACNCGPNGYQAGVKCDNPFWHERIGRG